MIPAVGDVCIMVSVFSPFRGDRGDFLLTGRSVCPGDQKRDKIKNNRMINFKKKKIVFI